MSTSLRVSIIDLDVSLSTCITGARTKKKLEESIVKRKGEIVQEDIDQ